VRRDWTSLACDSEATRAEAERLGVHSRRLTTSRLDLTVDGADEIDPELNLIKGGVEHCYARRSSRLLRATWS